MEGEARSGKRLMVFDNTVSSYRAVEHSLSERVGAGATACYHGDMPREERAAALAAFGSDAPPLLICTDLAARCVSVGGEEKRVRSGRVCALGRRRWWSSRPRPGSKVHGPPGRPTAEAPVLSSSHPPTPLRRWKTHNAYPPHAQLVGGA